MAGVIRSKKLEYGIGDDENSWGLDCLASSQTEQNNPHKLRPANFNAEGLAPGTTIGILIDVDAAKMIFYANGKYIGTIEDLAFEPGEGVIPAVSLNQFAKVRLAFGNIVPLQYCPQKCIPVGAFIFEKRALVHMKRAHLAGCDTFGKLLPIAGQSGFVRDDQNPLHLRRLRCIGRRQLAKVPSLKLSGVIVTTGKWYYEITLEGFQWHTPGAFGWADLLWTPTGQHRWDSPTGAATGVGCDKHSWGCTPCGEVVHDGKETEYWKLNFQPETRTVYGIALDADEGTLRFSKNGKFCEKGDAFAGILPGVEGGLTPAVSVGSEVTVSFGPDFKFAPPPGEYKAVSELLGRCRNPSGEEDDDTAVAQSLAHKHSQSYQQAPQVGDEATILPANTKMVVTSGHGHVLEDASGAFYATEYEPSMAATDVHLMHGCWYYEVGIVSMKNGGGACIGWGTQQFFGDYAAENGGVGGDKSSWGAAFSSPTRPVKRHNSAFFDPVDFGRGWKEGDVIGCMCKISQNTAKILFTLNGSSADPMGLAYENCRIRKGLMPAVSLFGCMKIRVNLGESAWAYPPDSASLGPYQAVSLHRLITEENANYKEADTEISPDGLGDKPMQGEYMTLKGSENIVTLMHCHWGGFGQDALRLPETLTGLSLCSMRLQDEDLRYVLDVVLGPHSSITDLDLSKNHISNEGALVIDTALKKIVCCSGEKRHCAAKLKRLDISHNHKIQSQLNGPVCKMLHTILCLAGLGITSLNLSNNNLKEGTGKCLRECLSRNAILTHLDVHHALLDSNDLQLIAEALEVNHTLTHLNISQNNLAVGCDRFVSAMKEQEYITKLELGDCKMGPEGVATVATFIRRHMPSITSVDMSRNSIGPTQAASIEVLAQMMRGPEDNLVYNLLHLELSGNNIGPLGELQHARALSDLFEWVQVPRRLPSHSLKTHPCSI